MDKTRNRPIKYLTNKELLAEIARCKNSYCTFLGPHHANYDAIVQSMASLTPLFLNELLDRLNSKLTEGETPRTKDGLIIRVMTHDHVPIDPERKRKSRVTNMNHARTNFPPFKHFMLQVSEDGEETWLEVGRSHWKGDFETGHFTIEKGRMSERLGMMFMMLVERYSGRSNWRGYCVDDTTEALTQRGWVNQSDLSENDKILSFDGDSLVWSDVISIYRGQYDGNMFRMTAVGFDALVTPNHKWVTADGLKKVDYLLEKDRLVLMGRQVQGATASVYSDSFVELVGWVATEGSLWVANDRDNLRVAIYQNEGAHADRIRTCLARLGEKHSETRKGSNVRFLLSKKLGNELQEVLAQDRAPSMNFMLSLTSDQRDLLLNTMLDGDGWRTIQKGSVKRGYCQKSDSHTDAFVALCTMQGIRTSVIKREIVSFGKNTAVNVVTLFSAKRNVAMVENVDFHGGKRKARRTNRGKANHPNVPTEYYRGLVWCPETQYGCFVARRNGYVYLTGNTYRDEMCGLALAHLAQVGLQFDESKSSNPFAFFTTTIGHCFTRTLNLEKKNQSIRDDLLINMGMSPSYTRQIENELAQSGITEPKKIPGKRGRKSAKQVEAEKAARKEQDEQPPS